MGGIPMTVDLVQIDRIKDELKQKAKEGKVSIDKVFEAWCAHVLLDLPWENCLGSEYHIGEGGNDHGIDFAYYDDEILELKLFQCKYSDDSSTIFQKRQIESDYSTAEKWLSSGDSSGNSRVLEFRANYKKRIHYQKQWIACVFGQPSDSLEKWANINDIKILGIKELCDEYHYFCSAVRTKNVKLIETPKMDKKAWLQMSWGSADTRAFLFKVDIVWLYEQVKKHNYALFESNLRYKIRPSAGRPKDILEDITRTLEDHPERFIYLNNGITIAAKKIEAIKKRSSPQDKLKITWPQIINGCQTSSAIYSWCKKYEPHLDDVRNKAEVLVKALEVRNEDKRVEITKAANLQNPIEQRDLYSEHSFQISKFNSLEQWPVKIFYDRKKGLWDELKRRNDHRSFLTNSNAPRIISNDIAGQLFLSQIGFPGWAANNKRLLFSEPTYTIVYGQKHDLSNFSGLGNWSGPKEGGDKVELINQELGLSMTNDDHSRDIIFNYILVKYSYALTHLYRNYKKRNENRGSLIDEIETSRGFLPFWHWTLVRIINYIIIFYCEKDKLEREKIQEQLIDTNSSKAIDIYFSSASKIAKDVLKTTDPEDTDLFRLPMVNEENYLIQKWIISSFAVLKEMNIRWEQKGDQWKNWLLQKPENVRAIMNNIYGKLKSSSERGMFFPLEFRE